MRDRNISIHANYFKVTSLIVKNGEELTRTLWSWTVLPV